MFGILLTIPVMQAQIVLFGSENFDGNINYLPTSSSAFSQWAIDTNYYQSTPNSYRGAVPNLMGDSIVLTSPEYDFSTGGHTYVLLKFKHICKVSPRDEIRIEYKVRGTTWMPIPASAYLGEANNYAFSGFNANNYSE